MKKKILFWSSKYKADFINNLILKNKTAAGNPAKFIRHIEHKIDLEIFK